MVYLPILASIMGAAGTVWERTILKKKNIDTKTYLSAGFLGVVLAMLPFIYFFWEIKEGAFSSMNLFIFFLVVVLSIIANLFVFYSMKWAKLSRIEPARMVEPLFIILLAIIFSFFIDGNLYERNLKVIIPALIAGAAIVFSHIKKHHLTFSKYFTAALLGSFFFALEMVMTRMLLEFYSPMSLYFLRCLVIFVIAFVLFNPKFDKIQNKTKFHILIIGVIWFTFRVIVYYGYINLGVIFTTLIVMLMPIFIYLFAWKFLKEKVTWRNIIASIIILGCVLYVTLS